MASIVNATTNGIVTAGDNTGTLNIQVSGNTALAIGTDKAVTLGGGFNTKNIQETVLLSATSATGTVNVDILTSVVWYYTANATGNWTFNFRGNSGTTLDSVMVTGQSLTVAFLVQQGTTGYYATGITIDGTANTPVWFGGTAPTSADGSTLYCYIYTIIKTSSATFKVLAQRVSYS